MRPFKVYLIEVHRLEFVHAVPTESSHTWWEVCATGQALHRSEFRRIKAISDE